MAKAASPIRLQEDLMARAVASGRLQYRSAAEQIEYWAELGRQVATRLSPREVLALSTGLMAVRVEPLVSEPVAPESVFAALEQDRASGVLAQNVTRSAVRYQASTTRPGLLEQIGADGQVRVGRFQGGVFTPFET